MTPSRLRRLRADQQEMQAAFAGHRHIAVVGTEGDPAERYLGEFRLRGLVPDDSDSFIEGITHRAEVFLPMDYPRRPPFCRMLSPVFHPNIDPQKICIGDHWTAGQPLALIVVRIAEMITYQSYNVQSPLNAKAAAWAAQNIDQLPLETFDLSTGL